MNLRSAVFGFLKEHQSYDAKTLRETAHTYIELFSSRGVVKCRDSSFLLSLYNIFGYLLTNALKCDIILISLMLRRQL